MPSKVLLTYREAIAYKLCRNKIMYPKASLAHNEGIAFGLRKLPILRDKRQVVSSAGWA